MCNLLVLSSYYLYDTFYNVFKKYDDLSEKSLECILEQEKITSKKESEYLYLFLLKYYYQYCKQKNVDFTPDSFTKFIYDAI